MKSDEPSNCFQTHTADEIYAQFFALQKKASEKNSLFVWVPFFIQSLGLSSKSVVPPRLVCLISHVVRNTM